MRGFLQNSRGMALILTILIVSLIVALTVQFNTSMRSDLHAAVNFRDGIKLGYIAKSGFSYALAVLRRDASEGNVDSLREAWADSKALSEDSDALFGDGRFEVNLSDHSGRIQINQLIYHKGDKKGEYNPNQRQLLTIFLNSNSERFGLDPKKVDNIVDAIKDWIDEDDDPTRFSVKDSHYEKLKFQEELLLVDGITRELFYGTREKPGISRYLTTYGDDGKININTADSLILTALSKYIVGEDKGEEWLEYREDEKNGLSHYKNYPGMSDMSPDEQAKADSLLTTSSAYFEIKSQGLKGAAARQVTGMAERKDGWPRILSWKIE